MMNAAMGAVIGVVMIGVFALMTVAGLVAKDRADRAAVRAVVRKKKRRFRVRRMSRLHRAALEAQRTKRVE